MKCRVVLLFAALLVLIGALDSFAALPDDGFIQRPARQRVFLVTGIDLNQIPEFARDYYSTYHLQLERMFREAFDAREYDVRVVHGANAFIVSAVLQSGKNAAVFYVGHALASAGVVVGSGDNRTVRVTDVSGADVSRTFSRVHPNLRFLAIIGCDTRQAVAEFTRRGYFSNNGALTVFGNNSRTVEARQGLDEAITKSREVLNRRDVINGYLGRCDRKQGLRVEITRRAPVGGADGAGASGAALPAVMVEQGEKLVAVLPAIRPGDRQVVWANIVADGKLKLWVDAGDRVGSERAGSTLGEFEFRIISGNHLRNEQTEWSRFELNGQPLGVRHLYRYKGEPVSSDAFENYVDFECVSLLPRA